MQNKVIPVDLDTLPPSAMVDTKQAASVLGKSAQTLRKLSCTQGHAFSVRPVKIGQALRWRVSDLKRVLSGGADA